MALPALNDPSAAQWPLDFIATDMDGTLTQAEKFTPVLVQTLWTLQTAGVQVLMTTGRSAGWVQGLMHYLPIVGAIAENGGLFYAPNVAPEGILLSEIEDRAVHRQRLAALFTQLQAQFPEITPAADNAFRVTDWTYDNPGFSLDTLSQMAQICADSGWGFTYSTVQCHIKPLHQNKQTGLIRVLNTHLDCPRAPASVITIGDSPNDVDLFESSVFPYSVGVANVAAYLEVMAHQPKVITQWPEVDGFVELATWMLQRRGLGV